MSNTSGGGYKTDNLNRAVYFLVQHESNQKSAVLLFSSLGVCPSAPACRLISVYLCIVPTNGMYSFLKNAVSMEKYIFF